VVSDRAFAVRGHARRLRGRPIACALIAIAGLAPSAAAAEPRSFWGVSSQTGLGAADLARMGEAEVGTLRALFSWATVEPVAGARDWSAIDAVVAEAAANEIAVLPFLYGTPDWVAQGLDRRRCAGDCAVYPPRSDAALLSWRRFVGDAVRRYGRGGEFWAEHPTLPKQPIFAWQIWNEQNSPDFFAPRISSRRYARLLDRAAKAIRGVNRRAEVILGGMAEIAGVAGAKPGWAYLRALYRRRGARRDFDGIAPHAYAASFAGVRGQIAKTRRAARAAGDPETTMWITEIGVASGRGEDPFELGPAGQAAHLRRSFRFLRRRRRALAAKAVIWFSWRDAATAICGWCPTSGLFDGSYAAKPAFQAFTRFTGGA
jgi:polysaccharide biosynthesis protein PslG